MTTSDEWLDPELVQATIEEESRRRRENPVECFAAFLRDFWTDNTEEEARLVWESRARLAPEYAEDALYCLDAVVLDKPPDLEQIVREQGNLYLSHQDGSARPYTYEETLAWLRQVAKEFRAIYESAHDA